jgi:monovalent cation:H+ antiporter-2, CPA2 family
MESESSKLLLEFGAIMLIAFIGAAIAYRFKQSAILAYIIVGILIGPFMYFKIGDFEYDGLVENIDFVTALAEFGLLLLIFFVGLEFSMEKIKKVKGPAAILALIDVGINLFVGFLLAFALGWDLIDAIFLAAIIAMSCSAVAMKTLMDLGRLDKPETDYIIGMVIMEEFISMIILTVVGGLVINTDENFSIGALALGMIGFFLFFIILAVFVIPRVVKYLVKMESDELFVLFMLGVVFLSAAFAVFCGVPPLIGAFFIGMVFAETKVMERMEKKISPLRDAFAAIFFVSFGMLIDPAMFSSVWVAIAAAVMLIIFAEVIVMSCVAYLVGFNRRASVTIGSAFTARGGESIMYASVATQVPLVTKAAYLNPIAGAITFFMSSLCPVFIKRSYQVADWCGVRFPQSIKYGAAVFQRTLGKLVFPKSFKPFHASKKFMALLFSFVAALVVTVSTTEWMHLAAFIGAIVISALTFFILVRELHEVVRRIDYSNLGAAPGSSLRITSFVASAISLGLMMCSCVAFMFPIVWESVIIIASAYVAWFLYLMKIAYDHTCMRSKYVRDQRSAYLGAYAGSAMEKEGPYHHLPQEATYRKDED